MLQLKNESPFAPAITVFPDRQGIDTLYVVVKGTFVLRPHLAWAEKPVPVTMADEYFGEPTASSLKACSELHIGKPSTDVVLMGQAWSPDGRPVRETVVMVQVAERRKVVRVVGERVFMKGGGLSDVVPFSSMPLVYERAFGGTFVREDGTMQAEERNPIGRGFLGKRSVDALAGQPAPNLEDPTMPLEKAGQTPTPACFGFVAPSWLPRRAFAGTYDEAWQRSRAPYLPNDFDPRFFNVACPELTFDRYLQGGEPVQVLGASKEGPLAFALPPVRPLIDVRVAGATEQPAANLEMVLIEPDENRLCLTWRASLPCDRKVLKVEEVTVRAAG